MCDCVCVINFRIIIIIIIIMRIVTKWLRLRSRCFHYNVVFHLSYMHIKFEDKI